MNKENIKKYLYDNQRKIIKIEECIKYNLFDKLVDKVHEKFNKIPNSRNWFDISSMAEGILIINKEYKEKEKEELKKIKDTQRNLEYSKDSFLEEINNIKRLNRINKPSYNNPIYNNKKEEELRKMAANIEREEHDISEKIDDYKDNKEKIEKILDRCQYIDIVNKCKAKHTEEYILAIISHYKGREIPDNIGYSTILKPIAEEVLRNVK